LQKYPFQSKSSTSPDERAFSPTSIRKTSRDEKRHQTNSGDHHSTLASLTISFEAGSQPKASLEEQRGMKWRAQQEWTREQQIIYTNHLKSKLQ